MMLGSNGILTADTGVITVKEKLNMEAGAAKGIQIIFLEEGFSAEARPDLVSPQEKERFELYEKDRYLGMYRLGLAQRPSGMSQSESFIYLLAETFFNKLTDLPELELVREQAEPVLSEEESRGLLAAVPFSIGAEYVDEGWIGGLFRRLQAVFAAEISNYEGSVALYLTEKNQHLRVPERVFFHLVENKDDRAPFAFMATYATKGEDGKVRHMPLKFALTEYGNDRKKLLALLSCLNRAAEGSELIAEFMESGEMFHGLYLTAEEAYLFLKDIEVIEEAGILCRIPDWWKRKAASVSLSITLGEKEASMLGFDTLVSVQPGLAVDGVPLTKEDVRLLLEQTEGLALLKGKWVEVDHKKLKELLKKIEKYPDTIHLWDALRMGDGGSDALADVGELVTNGKWLSGLLADLRKPENVRQIDTPDTLRAKLRPYQTNGYTWLAYMNRLGFGACLADDMGLGKTVQVLAYLEKLRTAEKGARVLLVVPASLLGNWQKEAQRFAPSMDMLILHGKTAALLEKQLKDEQPFLTVTTYGMASRIKALKEMRWRCVVLDEAQAIKNPLTNQTREIKKLKSDMRIAMTGTPIENDLTNLWSLFDFLNKGLLGTSKEFRVFCKGLEQHPQKYAKLKLMVSPFMLRRVKTDKKIISDLPDKIETVDYAALSKRQIVLYRKIVQNMEEKLADLTGIERKGVILSTIMRLKQVCNHPDQYLGQQAYAGEESGKFGLLKEICETIHEKRERVLVFTQFREITEYLADYLQGIFGSEGYVLHGGTPVKKRTEIVEAFQGERYVPFIVLSVKAGGTGLNLTKANHVIHFDRWWNPAVENQATDRAFRIGQTKDVLVHKMVCTGTIEEKIDAMINSKKHLAESVIGAGGESWITELSDQEIMSLMRLE